MSNPPQPENLLDRDQPIDLTNCDREPIHIPGRIQPHGVLLALQEPDLIVAQISGNASELWNVPVAELIGKPVESLLPEAGMEALRNACDHHRLDSNPTYLVTMQVGGEGAPFDAILHRSRGMLVLELESVSPGAHQDTYALVRQAVTQIQSARTMEEMHEAVVLQVKRITGFDRVMVYKFDAAGHGSVVAESKRDDLEPFLGLHYPASDIPAQARRLYTLNLLRLIPDVGYTTADVVPVVSPETGASLDMSYCVLRSVSPIHVQYLKNMGVGASMSISIVQEGELWGLIACHHYSPYRVAYDVRTACEFVGRVVSLQLANKQDAADVSYKIQLKDVQAQLVRQMASEPTYQQGLVGTRPNLLDFIEAEGAAVCTSGEFLKLGRLPDDAFLGRLCQWLAVHGKEEVFATDQLASVFPEASAVPQLASGLLAAVLSAAQQHYLLWFRPEQIQTVNWAGDPHKPVEVLADGSHRLTPRGSFALWKETVRSKSLPWKPVEIEAARELRRAMIHVILRKVEQLEALNAQLKYSNAELDAFTYTASHDLREPLRGIRNYAQFVREDYSDVLDAEGQEHLETLMRLTERMETLIDSLLRYSRAGRQELAVEPVDLNELLAESLEAFLPHLQETGTEVRTPHSLPVVSCDAVQVGQIFANLISNAIKYNNKSERWIEIGVLDADAARQALEQRAPGRSPAAVSATIPVFYVSDNGIGIRDKHLETIFGIFKRLHPREAYGGGSGAGLTIARKMAERHGGNLWVQSVPDEGTTFYFTLQGVDADAR